MLKDKEKQIPNKLLDHDYMVKFFESRAKDIDGRIKSVASLDIYPIKKYIDNVYFHLVILYALTFFLEDGSRKRFKIYCASRSSHLRRKKYQVMKLAYEHGFKSGKVLVPRPLWYIEELEAVFYVGMQGENILEHIKNGAPVRSAIRKAAAFLVGFHLLKPPKDIKLKKHKFGWQYLDPTDILKHEKNKEHKFTQEIYNYYEQLKKYFDRDLKDLEFELSHGDFHPENIIINKFDSEQIAIIDFSESCLAPYNYDVGSFLQQLRFMTLAYDVNGEKYNKWKEIFLNEYFYRRKIKLDNKIKKQIILYQTWTALKSAVYYMSFNNQYEYVEILLKQVKEFLQNYEK